MERARTADDQKAVRSAHDDLNGIFASLDNRFQRSVCDWNLGDEQLRRNQGVLAQDYLKLDCQCFFLLSFVDSENWRGKLTARVVDDCRFNVQARHFQRICVMGDAKRRRSNESAINQLLKIVVVCCTISESKIEENTVFFSGVGFGARPNPEPALLHATPYVAFPALVHSSTGMMVT